MMMYCCIDISDRIVHNEHEYERMLLSPCRHPQLDKGREVRCKVRCKVMCRAKPTLSEPTGTRTRCSRLVPSATWNTMHTSSTASSLPHPIPARACMQRRVQRFRLCGPTVGCMYAAACIVDVEPDDSPIASKTSRKRQAAISEPAVACLSVIPGVTVAFRFFRAHACVLNVRLARAATSSNTQPIPSILMDAVLPSLL